MQSANALQNIRLNDAMEKAAKYFLRLVGHIPDFSN
jgi:hypothetical protein